MVKSRFKQDGTTYSLIIMDLKLPAKDGFETTRDIINFVSKVNVESGQVGETAMLPHPFICLLTSICSDQVKVKAK